MGIFCWMSAVVSFVGPSSDAPHAAAMTRTTPFGPRAVMLVALILVLLQLKKLANQGPTKVNQHRMHLRCAACLVILAALAFWSYPCGYISNNKLDCCPH